MTMTMMMMMMMTMTMMMMMMMMNMTTTTLTTMTISAPNERKIDEVIKIIDLLKKKKKTNLLRNSLACNSRRQIMKDAIDWFVIMTSSRTFDGHVPEEIEGFDWLNE